MNKFACQKHLSLSVLIGTLAFTVSVRAADEIAITEVAHVVVGGVGSTYVEVANLSNVALNVNGWRLCSLIDYDTPAWGTLMNAAHGLMQPGDVVVVSIRNNDVANIQAAVGASNYVQFNWAGFTNAAIEDHYDFADLALYTSSPFSVAGNMRDFIKWNTAGTVGRTILAVPNSNTFWPNTAAQIASPLSTNIADQSVSNSFQLDMCETSPGSGVFLHSDPARYFVVNGADHTLGSLPFKGDFDLDGAADLDDVSDFVDVLLGLDTDPVHAVQADMNCDGLCNGDDIQPFVGAVL
ncbi:MAG: hypothetical protein MI923_07290 [Phycisphaerales bacterium]|nr:hypothetical protein [Phycisphaerales bacterium]